MLRAQIDFTVILIACRYCDRTYRNGENHECAFTLWQSATLCTAKAEQASAPVKGCLPHEPIMSALSFMMH
jgi:hypothetical protein